jgi:hypothetical protein
MGNPEIPGNFPYEFYGFMPSIQSFFVGFFYTHWFETTSPTAMSRQKTI